MSVVVLHSGKRPPPFVRGSLAWHRCRLCGELWDRRAPSGSEADHYGRLTDVCRECRKALKEDRAP